MDSLIELIYEIWRADSTLRDRSLLGESEDDRKTRRFIARLCCGLILVLIVVSVLFAWNS